MRFSKLSALIATTFLSLQTRALPRPAPIPISYLVVNVDGGSPSAAATPTTIIQTITDEHNSVVTTTITGAATPVTITKDVDGEATETAMIPQVSGHVVMTSYTIAQAPENTPAPVPSIHDTIVTMYTTLTASTSKTTSYYDNGMWHTSYAIEPSATNTPKSSFGPYSAASSCSRRAAWPSGVAKPTGYNVATGGW